MAYFLRSGVLAQHGEAMPKRSVVKVPYDSLVI